jgi:adenylate cyclase
VTVSVPAAPTRARSVAVGAALLVPLLGLALLVARPQLDLRWEHHPAHFWLVLSTAAVSAVLAWATGEAALRRGDARVLHVSLAFLSSAGFLALHALATPRVLLADPNAGFAVATPVGVALGSVFAARSTVEVAGEAAVRELRLARRLRLALVLLMVAWATVSLTGLPPLNRAPTDAELLPPVLAVPAILLYGYAAVRYALLWRRDHAPVLVAVLAACVLLGEAMLAMALARSWHLSWWEWHVLLLAAFVLVAVAARTSWREERFAPLYLEDTREGDREVSVLFADLAGFTSYSEQHEPAEVTRMLNDYLGVAVPAVTRHGGDVDRIIGDALMVTFNKRGDQPDHARRAAAAALDLVEATSALAAGHLEWPRFRVGVNTGRVSVSLLGTVGGRTHTVIGDTVNTASRIEARAPAGGVAIGPETRTRLPDAVVASLGPMVLKGKSAPVEVFLLIGLGERAPGGGDAPGGAAAGAGEPGA